MDFEVVTRVVMHLSIQCRKSQRIKNDSTYIQMFERERARVGHLESQLISSLSVLSVKKRFL